MTQEERDNILMELKKGQEELIGRVGKLEEGQEELIGRVGKLEEGQDELKADLRSLSQTVAKMEVQHGDKLEIILDVLTSYPEKFNSTEKRLDKHDNILDKHADQIYYLNSKVQAF